MSESLNEQIEYGIHCQHGTALGTPGGADLMCGLCEDGLDVWIDDPRFRLVEFVSPGCALPFLGFEIQQSTLDEDLSFAWRRLVKAFAPFMEVTDETWREMKASGYEFGFQQMRSGYWTDEGRVV